MSPLVAATVEESQKERTLHRYCEVVPEKVSKNSNDLGRLEHLTVA